MNSSGVPWRAARTNLIKKRHNFRTIPSQKRERTAAAHLEMSDAARRRQTGTLQQKALCLQELRTGCPIGPGPRFWHSPAGRNRNFSPKLSRTRIGRPLPVHRTGDQFSAKRMPSLSEIADISGGFDNARFYRGQGAGSNFSVRTLICDCETEGHARRQNNVLAGSLASSLVR